MLKIGIIGATGYTGSELVRLLTLHPKVNITLLTSERQSGIKFKNVVPLIGDQIPDLVLQSCEVEKLIPQADFFFCALPHGTSIPVVAGLVRAGKPVVDLSADYRFQNLDTYEKWYEKHKEPEIVKLSVYGLAELYREKIRKARLVGNPGCYPTSALLPLIPLIKAGIIKLDSIIIDSKSGASGAGKTPDPTLIFCEVNESIKAYKVGEHRHTPEIEEVLSDQVAKKIIVSFTPHLIPMTRGILTTIYFSPSKTVTTEDVLEILSKQYSKEPFVKVLEKGTLPTTAQVKGTNCCYIAAKVDQRAGRVIIVSVIDNLIKGAAGAAIQNMNIMNGWEEALGLPITPLYP